MERQRQTPQTFLPALPSLRVTALFILITTCVAFSAWLCAIGDYREAAVVAAVALGGAFLVSAAISAEAVLVTWFATTPFASFYIRFPTDRSIITFNRAVFVFLVIMLILKARRLTMSASPVAAMPARPMIGSLDMSEPSRAGFTVSRFELAWALLSVVALASAVTQSNNVDSATRIAVDTFWLPLIAFHVARNYFDPGNRGRSLLPAAIALALFLFATGVVEFVTGTDLFGYKGSELVREGERRVNGPFAADSSFAIICLLLLLFLLVAPRLFRVRFDVTGKLVYGCALAGAALGALLPLFRAVAIALVVCWIAFEWFARGSARLLGQSAFRRGVPLGAMILAMLIALFGWAPAMSPSIFAGRWADPRTAFGRLATWQAAAEISLKNPLFGVGLGNYAEYYDATHYYSDQPDEEVLKTTAADSPHSNLLWISSELGMTGLALYIAANLYLFLMGWRALKRAADRRQRRAASCFLALVLAYWIPGLTLASGYYSDLNLYFLFLLGMLSSQLSGREYFHRRGETV